MAVYAGKLLLAASVLDGYVEVDAGRIVEWGEGPPPAKPAARGWIVPSPVNAHTHIADSFLRDRPKPARLAELVGPGGWKHQQLAATSPDDVAAGILRTTDEMAGLGTSHFIDFREGGVGGVQMLRGLEQQVGVTPVIFGRPATNAFDADEAAALLLAADGIGLSALRDFPRRADVEQWAEAAHAARKPFALHVSEAEREDMEAVVALEPEFVVHCTRATPRDLALLADEGIPVVVCPRSNRFFGLKTPLPAMLEAGLTVAVGSDNGMLASGNVLEDLAVLRDWHGTDPATLLRMASWNGRRILGLPAALPAESAASADLVVLPEQPLPRVPPSRPGLPIAAGIGAPASPGKPSSPRPPEDTA